MREKPARSVIITVACNLSGRSRSAAGTASRRSRIPAGNRCAKRSSNCARSRASTRATAAACAAPPSSAAAAGKAGSSRTGPKRSAAAATVGQSKASNAARARPGPGRHATAAAAEAPRRNANPASVQAPPGIRIGTQSAASCAAAAACNSSDGVKGPSVDGRSGATSAAVEPSNTSRPRSAIPALPASTSAAGSTATAVGAGCSRNSPSRGSGSPKTPSWSCTAPPPLPLRSTRVSSSSARASTPTASPGHHRFAEPGEHRHRADRVARQRRQGGRCAIHRERRRAWQRQQARGVRSAHQRHAEAARWRSRAREETQHGRRRGQRLCQLGIARRRFDEDDVEPDRHRSCFGDPRHQFPYALARPGPGTESEQVGLAYRHRHHRCGRRLRARRYAHQHVGCRLARPVRDRRGEKQRRPGQQGSSEGAGSHPPSGSGRDDERVIRSPPPVACHARWESTLARFRPPIFGSPPGRWQGAPPCGEGGRRPPFRIARKPV